MSVQTRIGMPLDEFIQRYDEAPFELIDGELVPKMPTVSRHNRLGKRFFLALLPFEAQGIGEAFQEATYVLVDSTQWVKNSRIPDVMFVSTEKLAQFRREVPDADNKPYILIPDLVIEIVSPTDQYSEISRRVKRYLSDGVRLILIADPETSEVAVHRLGSDEQTNLSGDAILDGGDVLPGFRLSLRELFAD
jgi:Uma2 family endonuclease